jgi:lysophospholipase L1-like esterase
MCTIGAATACAVGMASGALAAAPTPTGAQQLPASRILFVEGDSLTVGSTSAIRSNLRGQFRKIEVDAEVGRNTPTGIARLSAGRRAHVWVLALGTNDGPDPGLMRRHVSTALKRAGPRPVIWVSVWRSAAYARVNRMLSRMDAQSTQLSVLRWDVFIRDNPHLLASDGVHLTSEGYQVRGRMIADAVRGVLGERLV